MESKFRAPFRRRSARVPADKVHSTVARCGKARRLFPPHRTECLRGARGAASAKRADRGPKRQPRRNLISPNPPLPAPPANPCRAQPPACYTLKPVPGRFLPVCGSCHSGLLGSATLSPSSIGLRAARPSKRVARCLSAASRAAKQEVDKGELSQIGISGKATVRALTNGFERAKFA
jgi:hypothetical protein